LLKETNQPTHSLESVTAQRFIFPFGPASQHVKQMRADGSKSGGKATPIVVDPSLKFRVDPSRQILDGFLAAEMQLPRSDLVGNFLYRFSRDAWTKATEELPVTIHCSPGSEREPQEVELLVRAAFSPVGILAVDHLRLFRM
jgi:hypothetical protein